MKRGELTSLLQKEYSKDNGCGVEKIQIAGLENIWFVVPPPPPRALPKGLPSQAIRKAMRILEQLQSPVQADELDHLSSYLCLRREAIQSSRMEGTWSTIDHIFTPGVLYDDPDGKSERASVLGYAHALEAEFRSVFKRGATVLTKELVCRLHKNVVSKDPMYRGNPGAIRKSPVFIGGLRRKEESIYNPTPPRHVMRCLREVLDWVRDLELIELGDAGMGMPLPVRMAIGHSHFEAVHPFSDGNGRVGRMLMTLQMASHGVLPIYLSGFIEHERDLYNHVLQDAQKKLHYGPIVEFICEAIVASYQEAKETKKEIHQLPILWAQRGLFRRGSTAHRLLTLLISNPIFTVAQIQELLKVSKPAASHAAAQLLKAKIIRERTGHERFRVFAAEEVLELLARKFMESPSLAILRAQDVLESQRLLR